MAKKKSAAKSLTLAQRVTELEKAVSILLLRSDEAALTKKLTETDEGSPEHATVAAQLQQVQTQLTELA